MEHSPLVKNTHRFMKPKLYGFLRVWGVLCLHSSIMPKPRKVGKIPINLRTPRIALESGQKFDFER